MNELSVDSSPAVPPQEVTVLFEDKGYYTVRPGCAGDSISGPNAHAAMYLLWEKERNLSFKGLPEMDFNAKVAFLRGQPGVVINEVSN